MKYKNNMKYKNKMRLINFLVKCINRLDDKVYRKLEIGDKFEIDIKKLVPKDNKWHSFAFTVEYWMKWLDEEEQKVSDVAIYKDGKEKDRILTKDTNEKEIFKKVKKYKADYWNFN